MNEKIEQIKAAMADETFVNSCIEAENEEAVQKLFAGKGIEMSLEEIELMKEMLCAVADGQITEEQLEKLANCGELSEDELAEAAGGINLGGILDYLRSGDPLSSKFAKLSMSAGKDGVTLLQVGFGIAAAVTATLHFGTAIGVDVAGGVKTGYKWVKDNITRW
ncbi:MAG: hypothetical protein IKN55_06760 [Oscillospiraceae bacterium]|nr:hypothetical protein [Oscillospiraceae bacterium]